VSFQPTQQYTQVLSVYDKSLLTVYSIGKPTTLVINLNPAQIHQLSSPKQWLVISPSLHVHSTTTRIWQDFEIQHHHHPHTSRDVKKDSVRMAPHSNYTAVQILWFCQHYWQYTRENLIYHYQATFRDSGFGTKQYGWLKKRYGMKQEWG
jgi:hypothetical protein